MDTDERQTTDSLDRNSRFVSFRPRRGMSVQEFCHQYGLGRTRAYEELKVGRLRARKSGRRTIITEDDAEEWLKSLPALP